MENDKPDRGLLLQNRSLTGGATAPVTQPSPANQPKIVTRNINAYFGKTQALRDVSLSIREKRVTAIIGPSGCGKSTFLRCLNRMHEVARGTMTGEILLDGHSVMEHDPVLLRRRVRARRIEASLRRRDEELHLQRTAADMTRGAEVGLL